MGRSPDVESKRDARPYNRIQASGVVFSGDNKSFSPGRTNIRPEHISPPAVPWRHLVRALQSQEIDQVREAVHTSSFDRTPEQLNTIFHGFDMANLQQRRDWNRGNAQPGTRLRSTNGPMRVVRPNK